MGRYIEITSRVDEQKKNDFLEMAHGFFVVRSILIDSDGEPIRDLEGHIVSMTKEFTHFTKEKIFDYIIGLSKTDGIHYANEISYEHY